MPECISPCCLWTSILVHTRKDEVQKNLMPKSSVIMGILLQQQVQATVGRVLFLVSILKFLSNVEYCSWTSWLPCGPFWAIHFISLEVYIILPLKQVHFLEMSRNV